MLFITTLVLVGGKQVTSLITNPYKIIQQPFICILTKRLTPKVVSIVERQR